MKKELQTKPAELYSLFAEILEYPTHSLYECFEECISILLSMKSGAAKPMRDFQIHLARVPLAQMQEVYTRTFDLQPACYPYLGHHLFGEDYRRGSFMAGLMKHYRSYDFSPGKELPDHIAIILRFLAQCSGSQENDELILECLIPALERMLSGLKNGGNPYGEVLGALLITLQTRPQIFN